MTYQNGTKGTLFVYVDEGGHPWLARFSVPGLVEDMVPENADALVHIAREHLRTVLDCLHPDVAHLGEIHFNNFKGDNEEPEIHIELEAQYEASQFDPGLFQGLFKESMSARTELRWYQLASKSQLPPEYRYLSLFKILELTYRRKVWDYIELDKVLASAHEKLVLIYPNLSPRAVVFKVRDMCAHAVLGKKKVHHGAMGLTLKQDKAVNAAIQALLPVGKDIMNQLGKGRFGIGERNLSSSNIS